MFPGKGEKGGAVSLKTVTTEHIGDIQAGEMVNLEGVVYTARDKALSRLQREGKQDFLNGSIIYFAGPSGENERGMFACGPTTSQRMHDYIPFLFECGVQGIIGKGSAGLKAFRGKGIYMLALGGCGALYGSRIVNKNIIMYRELGAEAVYRMEIENFPVIIAIDSNGKSINTIGSKDE